MILRPCRCLGADMPALGFAAPRLRFGPVRMPLGMDGATALRKGRVRTGLGAGKRPLTSGGPPPGRSCAAGAARPPPAIGFGPVPKQQFGRWAAGKLFVIRGQGLPLWAGSGNAARFPRPRGTVPTGPAGPRGTQASARPGGGEAPAGGGAGAGRGLWAPGWPRISGTLWQGRWPLPERPGIPKCVRTPLRAGPGKATRVSPAPARRCPVDRWVQAPRKASARPGGREAPAGGGAGAGRGLWPPAGPDPSVAQWQGRWPLPLQR